MRSVSVLCSTCFTLCVATQQWLWRLYLTGCWSSQALASLCFYCSLGRVESLGMRLLLKIKKEMFINEEQSEGIATKWLLFLALIVLGYVHVPSSNEHCIGITTLYDHILFIQERWWSSLLLVTKLGKGISRGKNMWQLVLDIDVLVKGIVYQLQPSPCNCTENSGLSLPAICMKMRKFYFTWSCYPYFNFSHVV